MKWHVLASLLILALVVLAILTTAADAFAVVFGCIYFLVDVLPRVTVYWPSVAVGCGAFVLFTAGVHWAGKTWRARTNAATRWRFRWSLSIVALVCLLFAAGIAFVGIVHQSAWLAASDRPLMRQTWRHANNSDDGSDNLFDIAVASHNYAAGNNDTFPAGGTYSSDGLMLHSWATYLSPYVGEGYSTRRGILDLTRPWNDPQNQPVFRSVIRPYLNPALGTSSPVDADGYGLCHYAANVHVMGPNRAMKLADITDGKQNTLLIGEVNAEFKPWGHPGNWRDPAKGINRSPNGFGGPARAGGAQFLMADGSVRFVSEKISPTVLKALSTPNGGEKLEEDIDDILGPPRR